MTLNNRTAFSLLLALAGRVPAGATPGLDRLLDVQEPGSTTHGFATFDAVPTAEQVRALEALGLSVQPMHHVALAKVAGPVSAMQAAVAQGIATDVHLNELERDTKPVRSEHRFTRETRFASPRDAVILSMVR